MESNQLIATGLTAPQAEAYLYLLEHGKTSPPQLAAAQKLTRSNAYKVLDKLVELGLAVREEHHKKFTYLPGNPMNLNNLAAEQRNAATAREEAVKNVMGDLLKSFRGSTNQPHVHVVSGKEAVINAYRTQIRLLEPIYFVRSRSDVPMLGFDEMHEIRTTSTRHGVKRYGITPDINRGPTTTAADKRSSLERTWMKYEDYTAPVEWSVCGSTLLIVVFDSEPHAITITNEFVAEAFLQMWTLLRTCLRAMPYYNQLPRTQEKVAIYS